MESNFGDGNAPILLANNEGRRLLRALGKALWMAAALWIVIWVGMFLLTAWIMGMA